MADSKAARTPRSPKGEDLPLEEGMHYGATPKLFEFAKELRQNQTKAEEILWEEIKNRQLLGKKFRRQHPIDRYIADFYCHELKYVIEVDGGYHEDQVQKKYDFNRDGEMILSGIFIRRFKNIDIVNNINEVLKIINKDIRERRASSFRRLGGARG